MTITESLTDADYPPVIIIPLVKLRAARRIKFVRLAAVGGNKK